MRKQMYTTYIMALLGIFMSSYMAYQFYDKETTNITAFFKKDINDKVNTLNREINNKIEILQTIKNLYLSSDFVTAEEFASFTKDIIIQHRDIKALEWVPRVLHEDREKVETQWKAYHPSFEITQIDKQNLMKRAYYRDEYYPVYYISPYEGNEEAFGFDLASDERRFKTLVQSRDTGTTVATSSIELVQEKENQKGLLFFVPVYKEPSNTILKRRENIMGFVLGVFRIHDFVYDGIRDLGKSSINIKIIDNTNSNEVVYGYKSTQFQALNELGITKRLKAFASRQWSIEAIPTTVYYESRRTVIPYIIFVMGMSFVIIGSIYTFVIQRYALNIEKGIKAKSEKLKQINKRLDLISKTDGLTQIANRRYFDEFYKREFRRAIRDKNTVSLIMIDIDFFKNFNDSYGHLEGDNCLKEVAKTLSTILHRPGDLIARYGGEEFILVLPNTKDAVTIAHKCVEAVRDLHLPHESSEVLDILTISAGVSSIKATNIKQMDELILKADEALYKAKESGRNQVVVST